MAPALPLMDRAVGDVVFWRGGVGVTAGAFVADARALAARLPPGRYVANLCRDRYAFAVGFAAGLLAGRTALLNVDAAGQGASLEAVLAAYPGCSAVVDGEGPGLCVPSVRVGAGGGGAEERIDDRIAADHVAAVVFTSGSTGVPVGHPKSWGAMVACTRAAAARFGFAGGTVIVGMVPPHHMYGLETTVLMPLHAHVASWCGSAFFSADVAAAVAGVVGRAVLVTTPFQVRMLLASGTVLEGLEAVISATAPLPRALAAAVEAAWGTRVMEVFGATECGSIASRRTVEGEAWLPYPGTVVRLRDGGAEVEAPGAGVVALADVLEAVPGGGNAGRFRLLGRRTDVVKLGGRRASLPGLNQVLAEVPGVDEGVFVVPDEGADGRAARLVAVVVAPGRSGASILADLRGRIDPAFMPRRVVRVEAMPRNAVGKLPRAALLRLVAGE